MNLLVIILIVLLLVGAGGSYPMHAWSTGWGYGPSGVLGIIVVVLLILVLTGRL